MVRMTIAVWELSQGKFPVPSVDLRGAITQRLHSDQSDKSQRPTDRSGDYGGGQFSTGKTAC